MELINNESLKNALSLRGVRGELSSKMMMKALSLDKINKLYDSCYNTQALDFIESVLSRCGIEVEFDESELKKLPKGAFITVSNHPFGGIDGLLLLKVLLSARTDFKAMANYLLSLIEPLHDYIFPVNPFEHEKGNANSYIGLKESLMHLSEGKCLGLFPAGEVSTYTLQTKKVTDRKWQLPAIKFIQKAHVPVVPVYFSGTNSLLFHVLGKIHPLLRTAKLPSELFNKKNKKITIRIGTPISVEKQNEFTDTEQFGRFLRAKTYLLGSKIEVSKFYEKGLFSVRQKPKEIEERKPVSFLNEEIENISKEYKLFAVKEYAVFCAPARAIPNLLHEIGRMREITFRAVGEGTNHSIDLDEFDLYYEHLIVWDTKSQQLVGAYRVGRGKDILSQYSVKGFYLRSLFKLKKGFHAVLSESLELGRSFVSIGYQRKPLPLLLLWKGILSYLMKNPEYRYLIGPVSISNEFSKASKSVIVNFIKEKYYDTTYAQYVKPKKDFKVPKGINEEIKPLLNTSEMNIRSIDTIINDIEKDLKLPVLLKKYLSLNTKIIGFNIDPKFNNCLDGFIMLDIANIPLDILLTLAKELDVKNPGFGFRTVV